jgi:thymidine kinase
MSLDILLGPMFAGKSTRILSIISRYAALDTPVLVIKHASDVRYSRNEITTHNNQRAPCIAVRDLGDVQLEDILRFKVLIVDEAQFFQNLVPFVEWVVDTHKKHLYLVGLDGDSNRRSFESDLLKCIPLADSVEKLTAFCRRCADGTPGIFTYRHSGPHDQQVIVGGSELYSTLCRKCYLRQEN